MNSSVKGTEAEAEAEPQFFDLECFTSHSITVSMLAEFLQEIKKQQTSLSVIDLSPLHGGTPFSTLQRIYKGKKRKNNKKKNLKA